VLVTALTALSRKVIVMPPGSQKDGSLLIGLAVGVLSGYIVLQYADVRSSYPAAMTGRAMSVFTMALFLGVALMQWITGVAASTAKAQGAEPYAAVMFTIAGMLALGAAAFRWLPAPRQQV